MPAKGSTIYNQVIVKLGDPAPIEIRDTHRVPVILTGTETRDVMKVQRVSTAIGDKTEHADKAVELWTVNYEGYITERLSLRCSGCGWRANLHSLRLWRQKHRHKSWVQKFYCCLECKARSQRRPDKKDRNGPAKTMKDNDGTV